MEKTGKIQRIPQDATVGDLVVFAGSIGCKVEVRLIPRDAEQCVHPTSGGDEAIEEKESWSLLEFLARHFPHIPRAGG